MDPAYCSDFNTYRRRNTSKVVIGDIPLGSEYPVRLQSMTNTITSNVQATVKQIIDIYKTGADYVRLTIPSLKDTDSLREIMLKLRDQGCMVPVIADIHFNPKIAFISATMVDKVRINPGNFTDRKLSGSKILTDQEYDRELKTTREKLFELIEICRKHNTALRIGVNHGSLSDRIINRYGNTPEGMAESAMEFLRMCVDAKFNNIVVSMKASNTRIMVYATRLLVKLMGKEKMSFPLHLGVTEAGEGEDGRIKSAVGIGSLLTDGIGDTIRVSLTEDPVNEIQVARKLIDLTSRRKNHAPIIPFGNIPIDPYTYDKRESLQITGIGGHNVPVIIASVKGLITHDNLKEVGWVYAGQSGWKFTDTSPDIIACDSWSKNIPVPTTKNITLFSNQVDTKEKNIRLIPRIEWEQYLNKNTLINGPRFLHLKTKDLTHKNISNLIGDFNSIIVLGSDNTNAYADIRAAMFRLINAGIKNPVIFKLALNEDEKEDFQLKAAVELGGLFIDGLGEGIWLENSGAVSNSDVISTAFGILQASRVRISKTEYIACPSCGRTLFNIQATTQKIRKRTAHLKGLKIGIMGCVVNGPGEMADADYGYIGSGKGNVNLYKEKQLVKRNVPETEAVNELIQLIKENGDWIEPESPLNA